MTLPPHENFVVKTQFNFYEYFLFYFIMLVVLNHCKFMKIMHKSKVTLHLSFYFA